MVARAADWRWAMAAVAPALVAWVAIYASVPFAAQDFPLNDDWCYSKSAMAIYRGDGLGYGRWASPIQWAQWAWGWPFYLALGRDHAALRISTIVLSLVATVAAFDLNRRAGLGPRPAAFAAATLALNPLVFLLSGTFMTDVPALAFSLAAMALFCRGLDSGRWGWGVAAALAATAAALTRQNAVAASLTMAALAALRPGLAWRWRWAALALAPLAVAAPAYAYVASLPDVMPYPVILLNPERWLGLGPMVLVTLGLAALPVLLLRPGPPWARWAVAMVVVAVAWAATHRLLFGKPVMVGGVFPYLGNMLTLSGPFGDDVIPGRRRTLFTEPIRYSLTLVGALAAGALLSRLARLGRLWRSPLPLFALFHLPFMLVSFVLFDRYLIVLMPAALLAASLPAGPIGGTGARRRIAGGAGLAAMSLVAVALYHDWLAYNAARWALGRRAVASGIAATDIEGGFEWDLWHQDLATEDAPPPLEPNLAMPLFRQRLPRLTGRYAISFSPLGNATPIDRVEYDNWLPPARRVMRLLAAQAPAEPSPPAIGAATP